MRHLRFHQDCLVRRGNQIQIFKCFKDPMNRFQGINSASLCSPADRYDNPIPIRFLATIDCLKIPALFPLPPPPPPPIIPPPPPRLPCSFRTHTGPYMYLEVADFRTTKSFARCSLPRTVLPRGLQRDVVYLD